MHSLSAGRLFCALALIGLACLTIAACSGSNTSQFGGTTGGSVDGGGGPGILYNNGDGATLSTCMPKTCTDWGYTCGKNSDGCGGVVDCGTCMAPEFCGGGGYSKCGKTPSWQQDGGMDEGGAPCTPKTCADLAFDCGYAGDGCGNSLNCGGATACTSPAYCGGGGPQKCGGNVNVALDGGPLTLCQPKTCADLGFDCGYAGDGCGQALDCGGATACGPSAYCGGGGPNKCGTFVTAGADGGTMPICTPRTCADLGYDCGFAGDGCGNKVDCGGASACTSPEYCGGGGPNKCGGSIFVTPEGGTTSCTPTTCSQLGLTCGYAGDGCGKLLDCGGAAACTLPQYCGGGGPNKCGGSVYVGTDGGSINLCTPSTCSSLGYDCGYAGDGCGNQLDCGPASVCPSPQYCGGGGTNRCGGSVYVAPDGGMINLCTPTTCGALGYDCGYAGDGCGNQLNCGGASTCTAPQYCGGGGPNKCGGSVYVAPDGGTVNLCTPKKCAQLGYDCGPAGDGCGNLLNCGPSCPGTQYCGGGGPNVCGGNVYMASDGGAVNLCTPKTCASLGYDCGAAGDGCGNLLNCGSSCPGTQYCGGGGPNKCGGSIYTAPDGGMVNPCTPTTCATLGYNCGPAADGCGNLLQCGNCFGADMCGGGGTSGVCGHTCSGLCQYQATCMNGTPTTITGRVLAGQSAWTGLAPDPVPNVLVYVPNGTVQPLSQGYTKGSCPQCGADVSGNPLVSTYTNYDGTFTLTNVPTPPAGQKLPLVIQLGRWRRQVQLAPPAACAASSIGDLNLPRNHGEGDIPLTAISTGAVDALECVLMKMGVDQAEFTSSTSNPSGRVHIYAKGPGSQIANADGPGAYIPDPNSKKNPPAAISQPEQALMATGGTYMNYDQIVLPCWGKPVGFKPGDTNNMRSLDEPGDLVTYADSGGHFFATHYSYTWLVGNGEFDTVAKWHPDYNNPGDVNWMLNVSKVPPVVQAPMHSGVFWQWLNLLNALSNANIAMPPANPQVTIGDPRHDVDGVLNGSLDWIDGTDPQKNNAMVEHFTFNTPVAQTNQCGHAIFSDFHVANQANDNSTPFPKECTTTFTAQEKILEYMLFDLASCVTPPQSSCKPLSCAAQGLFCGPAGDGCGNAIDCGACASPLTCGGAGVHGQCGQPDGGTCIPLTCTQQGITCGPAGDGCGGVIQCGGCSGGQACGGGGVTGQCGKPDGGACFPQSCGQQGLSCGPAGDGCGGVIQCGDCSGGMTCGGGGINGQCGIPDAGACRPQSCSAQNIACGPAGDGCGKAIECGSCPSGQTCGGAGVNGQCGIPDTGGCTPRSCSAQNIGCGPAGDGCGNATQCGSCPAGQTCGGAGVNGQCGAPGAGACTPLSCSAQNIGCGPAGDGCGNQIQCGPCPTGQACGAGGVNGQCGAPDGGGGACSPLSCSAQNISCGWAGDGCGSALQCGGCPPGQTCGGAGVPGRCGTPEGGAPCSPLSCSAQNIGCGPAGDGCGNAIQCGPCVGGTCGGGGVPGQCGQPVTGQCTPQTCAEQNITCGPAGDGCGNQIQCGTCTAGLTCGGGGTPGQCGGGVCIPYTCAQLGYNCGPAGDGCGGLLDCGPCAAGSTCGGGGQPGRCGGGGPR